MQISESCTIRYMMLPFSVKIGPIAVELSEVEGRSSQSPDASIDFEYTRRCWNELKSSIDKLLAEELDKLRFDRSRNAKTRLAVEIINILGRQAVEQKRLKNELIKTGKFSKEEADVFLKEAIAEGIIYEGENGFYASAN